MAVQIESVPGVYPAPGLFAPSDELERLLVELVASENARLAAASPADGRRIARVLDATTAQKSGPRGLVAANQRGQQGSAAGPVGGV